MKRYLLLRILLLYSVVMITVAHEGVSAVEPTNVILIMTDNHSAWTLGSYGNPDIKTPNLDRMADESLRFAHSFSNNAVCSPTRATYLTEPINQYADYYAEKALPSFTRDTVHPWLHNNRKMINNPTAARKYASEVSGVDEGVGEILATLKRLDLDENTLVIFTADQELSGGQSGFWGMGDHTRPLTAFDWTRHVPLIVRHPGAIASGGVSDHLVSNYDLLPSVLDYLGLESQQAPHPVSPG